MSMTYVSWMYIVHLLAVSTEAFHPQNSPKSFPFPHSLHSKSPESHMIDADTLGIYTEADYACKLPSEWDPATENPNLLDPGLEYVEETPVDDDGIEMGWDPVFGPSNPLDERAVVDAAESYVVAEGTRDAPPPCFFEEGDVEKELNEEVVRIRKSLKMVETYRDEFLGMEVPKNTAKWHGEQETLSFPEKDFMNNRFTPAEKKTDFTKLSPYRARKKAVEMARSKNNEWLPEGYSREYNERFTESFRRHGTLVGSLKKGECDPVLVERIRPALKVFGSCVELLSIEVGTVYRFRFSGPMKHRQGMQAWMSTLIQDCGVECTGVVFETGGRKRDPGD